jgi:hypothetical protein
MSLHGRDELQADAREWLNRWRIQKEDRPYALAVLLDPEPANSSPEHPVLAYMKEIAVAAAADLFYSFCQVPVPAPLSMPPTQGRGQALTRISLTGCPRNPPGT